ncbi:MAG TPA: hypothetical protein VIB39_10890 [Candidatus Angelobacter sp.]
MNKIHLKAANRRAYWGWALIVGSGLLFWIEWHWHGTLVVPMVIGLNMILAGLRLIYWGKGGIEKLRFSQGTSSIADEKG